MANASTALIAQRDLMRLLVRRIGNNKAVVTALYADLERLGVVERDSDENDTTAEEYGVALWNDGMGPKGWLRAVLDEPR